MEMIGTKKEGRNTELSDLDPRCGCGASGIWDYG
jgi:hypothetical protein